MENRMDNKTGSERCKRNNKINIPFNKLSIVGKELDYMNQAVSNGKISGDGIFTKKCSRFIEDRYKTGR